MGCIRVDKITEYLAPPLKRALGDEDPYVRKTAALCVAKLHDRVAEGTLGERNRRRRGNRHRLVRRPQRLQLGVVGRAALRIAQHVPRVVDADGQVVLTAVVGVMGPHEGPVCRTDDLDRGIRRHVQLPVVIAGRDG